MGFWNTLNDLTTSGRARQRDLQERENLLRLNLLEGQVEDQNWLRRKSQAEDIAQESLMYGLEAPGTPQAKEFSVNGRSYGEWDVDPATGQKRVEGPGLSQANRMGLGSIAFPERAAQLTQRKALGEDPIYDNVPGVGLVQRNAANGPAVVPGMGARPNTSERYNDFVAAARAELGKGASEDAVSKLAASKYEKSLAASQAPKAVTYAPMAPEQMRAHKLPEGTVAYMGSDGKPDVVYRPPVKAQIMYDGDGRALGSFDPKDPDVAEQLQRGEIYLRPPKPVPTGEIEHLDQLAGQSTGLNSLLNGFQDEYGGHVIAGGAGNTYKRIAGDDTGQAQWWQEMDAMDATVRNKLFGASLTPGEQASWKATTVTPRMDSGEIRKRLAKRLEILEGAKKRRRDFYKAGGFNMGQVDSFLAPAASATSGAGGGKGRGATGTWGDDVAALVDKYAPRTQ